jgi:hypothetical protein
MDRLGVSAFMGFCLLFLGAACSQNGGNSAPAVNGLSAAPNPVIAGAQLLFSWTASDGDGDTLSCSLDVDNDGIAEYTIGDCANNTSQAHIYSSAGTFTARLTVSDGNGGSDQSAASVTVDAPNAVPSLGNLDVSPNPAETGSPVTFSWTASDADGDILTCTLGVDDDGVGEYTINDCANNTPQSHTYANAGAFTARLIASDGNGGSAEETVSVSVTQVDSLAVSVGIDSGPVPSEGQALFTITVGNRSAVPVDGVELLLDVPAGLSFFEVIDAEPSVDCSGIGSSSICDPGETPVWSLDALASGESHTISVNAQVASGTLDGTVITIPITVSAIGISDIEVDKSLVIDNSPSVDLALSASIDPVAPNETFTFELDFGNVSAGTLTNLQVGASVPAGVTVASISDGGAEVSPGEVVWNVASLGVGEALHREVGVTAAGVAAGEIVVLDAELVHDGGLEVDNSSGFAVSVAPAALPISVAVDAVPDPVAPGAGLGYTITVTNQSALPADAVTVLFRVPRELAFGEVNDAEPDTNCSGIGSSSICDPTEEAFFNLGTIASGSDASITINADVSAGFPQGTMINVPIRATATGLGDDINLRHTTLVGN